MYLLQVFRAVAALWILPKTSEEIYTILAAALDRRSLQNTPNHQNELSIRAGPGHKVLYPVILDDKG